LAWYFPVSAPSAVKIQVPVIEKLRDIAIVSLAAPSAQENYLTSSTRISLVSDDKVHLKDADAILLHDKNKFFDLPIIQNFPRVHIVDPWYYHSFEAFTYARLFERTLGSEIRKRVQEQSRDAFRQLISKSGKYKKAYVFGTGPSLAKARDFDYRDGFRIICNTTVKDQDLLDHIKPQLLVFLDEALFFSPSRYSAEFRRMVLKTVEKHGCRIMVPPHLVPFLTAHYPGLEGKTIGLFSPGIRDIGVRDIVNLLIKKPWRFLSFAPKLDRISGLKQQYNFPTPDNMSVMKTSSVMTSHMIPVASTIADEIYIIGADGRTKTEKYFWSYNPSTQFTELMQTLYDTHPSFFRDSVYTDYYKQNSKYMEEVMAFGESRGKRYFSLTPSSFPSLMQRMLNTPRILNE